MDSGNICVGNCKYTPVRYGLLFEFINWNRDEWFVNISEVLYNIYDFFYSLYECVIATEKIFWF